MSDTDPLRSEFAREFKRLIDALNAGGLSEPTSLMKRLTAHLGGDPTTLPIVAEEFEAYEHPNVQVGLDALLGPDGGRTVELVGIAMQNKRWGATTFSDLLAATGPWGRLSEGPVDYTNFELDAGNVVACVQFGLFIVSEGAKRYGVYVGGPPNPQMGPRVRLRVEVIARDRQIAVTFLRDLKT